MSEMVERVATQIRWRLPDCSEDEARIIASAAIAAMREPTEEMLEPAGDILCAKALAYEKRMEDGEDDTDLHDSYYQDAKLAWQAMIDVAMPPKP